MIDVDLLEFSAPPRNVASISALGTGRATGEAAYVWDLTTDQIAWDHNAGKALGIADLSRIATGRAFAMLHDADAVENACEPPLQDEIAGANQGVPYHTKYWLQPDSGRAGRLWVEDIGCWHRNSSDVPVRAVGILRVLAAEIG